MKVIMLEDVRKVGKKDDVIEVSDGYANNYLIKNGYAVAKTQKSTEILENQKQTAALEETLKIKDAEKIKKELENMKLTFKVKVGENDQVFGKISSKQISEKLKEKGYEIDKKKIIISDSINSLGITNVEVELHKMVKATLKIELVK